VKTAKSFNVYSSSAGSGKTYTLVREYLRLALSKSGAGNFRYILAITFTNKAAEEMKNRVLKSLKSISEIEADKKNGLRAELSELTGVDEQTLATRAGNMLQSMLHNYSDIAISTIDTFVHRLVRSFSRDLLLSHDFEVDTDTAQYLEEAVGRLMQRVGEDETISKILIDFVIDQTENDSRWQLEKILTEVGRKILDRAGSNHIKELSEFEPGKFDVLGKKINEFIAVYENTVQLKAQKAIKTISEAGLTIDDFSNKKNSVYGYFERIAAGRTDFQANPTTLSSIENQNFGGSKGASAANAFASVISDHFHEIENYRTQNQGTFLLCQELKKNLRQLSLLSEIHLSLKQIKEEQNLIFVDDFHELIANVVKNEPSPFIYERIGNRYKYLLIDEFQDTSILQWHNFLPLVEHALSENNFVLLVGDGKQAIYRWRGGEVEQFDRLPEIFGDENDPTLKIKEEVLKQNFNHQNLPSNYRSLGKIVDFNNSLYDELSKQLPAQMQSIYHDQAQKITRSADQGLIVSRFLEAEKAEDFRLFNLPVLLEYIEECLQDGFSYGDICIITRGNKDGIRVAEYLSQMNIPVISSESLRIVSNGTVQLLLAAMKHLSHPAHLQDALTLLIALANRLNSENINEVLQKYTKQGKKGLYSVDIKGYLKEFEIPWSAKRLLALPLYDLLETLIRDFKLQGESSLHLSFFKKHILQYATRNHNDLGAFLSWWQEREHKLSISTPAETDAVQIMSIHKSKGLQFPVVFLPFCSWDFKPRNTDLHWVETPKYLEETIGCEVPPAMLSTLSKSLSDTELGPVAQLENDRTLLDNLNMLYVATTRPEDRLYIITRTGMPKENAQNIGHWINGYAISNNWDLPEHRIGERSGPTKKRKEIRGLIDVPVSGNSGWLEKIKINKEAGDWLDGQVSESQRARGKLLHKLMAELEKPEDVGELITQYVNRGWLQPTEAPEIADKITEMLNLEDSKNWFGENVRVLNEKAILTPKGETYRPDRIVISGQNALIIDFKTGAHEVVHKKQIEQYGQLLQSMGYTCKMQLAYLEKPEILTFSAQAQTSLF
jgi:ATP-dependent exoDNAse (exonuclease V) beta subunit